MTATTMVRDFARHLIGRRAIRNRLNSAEVETAVRCVARETLADLSRDGVFQFTYLDLGKYMEPYLRALESTEWTDCG